MDIALLFIAARALIPTKVTVLEPISFIEIPPMTSLDVAETYVSADTAVALLTFEEWRQRNPFGTREQYAKYVTGFV